MPLVLRAPSDETPLTDRLADLGIARRRAFVLAGIFRFFAVALLATIAATVLDSLIHFAPFTRALLFAGTLTTCGVLYLRGIRTPAKQSTHPLTIALLLEDKYPRLNDSLASAIEFLTVDAPTAERLGSSRFRRVAVIRAQNMAERYDLDSIVPSGRAWRGFWAAVFAFCFASVLALPDPDRTRVALLRFADPYGGHRWPAQTTLEITHPERFPALQAKGDSFILKFTARGIIPDGATVQLRLAGGNATEELVPFPAPQDVAHSGESSTELLLDPSRIPRDFEIRVIANDADTGWLNVTVAPPPILVPLDGRPSPQVRLTFPEYTGLPRLELPDGAGVVEAVTGTRVHFRAATDRRIVSAVIRPQFDLTSPRAAAACAVVIGSDNPLSAVSAHLLTMEAVTDVPVRISGAEGTRLEVEFTPRLPGLHALHFTDEVGLTGTRLLDLRTFPDPAPVVALTRPDASRDPLTLLPNANIPLQSRAEDRIFAVRDAVLEYRFGGPDAPFVSLPLVNLPTVGTTAMAVLGTAMAPIQPKPMGLDILRTIPLNSLRKSDGSEPVDGDLITIRVASTDWDNLAWMKSPGRSREVEIRVLGKVSLETMFQKELAELRPELLRLREDQRGARAAVEEVARTAETGKITAEDVGKLGRAEEAQRQIRNQIADTENGIRAKVDRMRQTIRANNLPRTPTTNRVEDVANDLDRLAREPLEAANPAIAVARQDAEKLPNNPDDSATAKKLAATTNDAVKQQQSAEAMLDRVLEKLEQWGGAGEIRGQARTIKDQLERTGSQAEKATEKVPTGKPPEQLTPAEKLALEKPASKLEQIAQQSDELLGKAGRLADEKTKQASALAATAADKVKQVEAITKEPGFATDPTMKAAADALKAEADALKQAAKNAQAEADALKKAVSEAGGRGLSDDLKTAAGELRQNQQGKSADRRQAAADRLNRLSEALGEKPTETAEKLQKKRKQSGDAINDLAAAQDELQKKTKAAAANPDPVQRAEELRKLASEQEKLRRETEQLAQQLTRDREQKPAESLRRAAEEMAAAENALKRGQPPAEQQDEALERFDDALTKLEAEQQNAEEQLSREKREELAQQLQAIRDRQAAAVAEVTRLHTAAEKAKEWSRGQLGSYRDLGDTEQALADELRGFIEKNLAELPVFSKMAARSAKAMEKASGEVGRRVNDIRDQTEPYDPELEKLADARVRQPFDLALRRLDQILASLKDDPKANAGNAAQGGGGSDGGGGGGEGGGQSPGIPPLAQLKALRAMQAEVNEQTVAFSKAHPNPEKYTDDDRDELKELEETQREIAELFDKLAPELRSGPMPEAP